MKKNNWLSKLFVILVLLFNYLPIIVVVVYSFNASKYSNWAGFSLQWYEKLFRNSQILRSLNNSCIQEAMDEDMEKLQLVKAGVYSELDNLSEHPAYDMSLAHHQDVMGTKPRILIQPMSPLCADSEDHTDSEMPLPFGRRQSPPFGNNSLMVTTSYDDGGGRR